MYENSRAVLPNRRSGDGWVARAADLEQTGNNDGRVDRHAVGRAPFGRLAVNAFNVQVLSRIGESAEDAGLLLKFVEV